MTAEPGLGTVPRVALIGANGHGLHHRRTLAPLHAAGSLRLVGLCDVGPITEAEDAPLSPITKLYTDHLDMVRDAEPDVVIVCTPPHTHLDIATDVLRAGCDLLLEKPPVLSLAEHDALARVLAQTGRACQVGFQALASPALAELLDAVRAGRLGTVTGIAAIGAWRRDDAYYARSPWAGKRTLDGKPVLDGALANPFAHALMQALAVAEATGAGDPSTVEMECYRTRPIDVDDTTSLRVRLDGGQRVVVAVTLCGEEFLAGEIVVHGTGGRAVLEYPTDRLMLPGEADLREVPGRPLLLENLLAHRTDPTTPLVAPLSRTLPFTAVLEVLLAAPDPQPVPTAYLRVQGEGGERHTIIAGVNDAVRRAGADLALFSELNVPWAVAPTVRSTRLQHHRK